MAQSFVGLSFNCTPQRVIKGITIWGVGQQDVRGDVVTEIFSQPTLGALACVAWCRVLLPDVGSSSSNLFNPGQHNLLQALDVGLHVEDM